MNIVNQNLKRNCSAIDYFVYCVLVLLPIYRDSPLQKYLGIYGATLIPVVLVILYFFRILSKKPILYPNRSIKAFLYLGAYLFLISLICNLIYIALTNSMVVLGVNVFQKAGNVIVQYITFILYTNILLFYLEKQSFSRACLPFSVGAILLSVIGILESFLMPTAFSALHYSGSEYNRIRLLTAESSHTVLLIIIYFSLGIFYSLKKKNRILIAVQFLGVAYLSYISGSKTLYLMILLYIFVFLWYLLRHGYFWQLIILLIPIVIILFLVAGQLVNNFIQDLTSYTSTVTRVYTIFVGFLIGLVVPFGVGGGIYGDMFQRGLLSNLGIFVDFNVTFNLSEIIALATSPSDTAVAVKAGLFQYNMYWGIIGTILLCFILFKIYQRFSRTCNRATLLKTTYIISTILVFFAMDFCFEYFMLLAVMIHFGAQSKYSEFSAIQRGRRVFQVAEPRGNV